MGRNMYAKFQLNMYSSFGEEDLWRNSTMWLCTLSWYGGLCASMIRRAMSSGAFVLLAGAPKVNWSKGRGQTKHEPFKILLSISHYAFLSVFFFLYCPLSFSCTVHSLLGDSSPTCLIAENCSKHVKPQLTHLITSKFCGIGPYTASTLYKQTWSCPVW